MTIRRKLIMGFMSTALLVAGVAGLAVGILGRARSTLREVNETTLREVGETNHAAAAVVALRQEIDVMIDDSRAGKPFNPAHKERVAAQFEKLRAAIAVLNDE